MSSTASRRILLAEANGTVRRLMAEILEEVGFVTTIYGLEAVDASVIDDAVLAVVDLDELPASPTEGADEIWSRCQSAGCRILQIGIGDGPEREGAEGRLGRPFEPQTFLQHCCHTADVSPSEVFKAYEKQTTTQEIKYEESDLEALEEMQAEGLDQQTDVEVPQGEQSSDEGGEGSGEILEIDDSSEMILDVQDLEESEGPAGRLGDCSETETLDVDRLREAAEALESLQPAAQQDQKPTMPEVPAYKEGPGEESSSPELDEGASRPTSAPRRVSKGTDGGESTLRSDGSNPGGERPERFDSAEMARISEESSPVDGGVSSSMSGLRPDLERRSRRVAELVAEHWERFSLAARHTDRAERLREVLEAALGGGMEAAAREVERIPKTRGFSGELETLSVRQLLWDIERRGRRARLEIGGDDDEGYVLFVRGGQLDDIEDLSGRGDSRLLEVFEQQGMLETREIEGFRQNLDDSLSAPLEMQLRLDSTLDDQQLRAGKIEWARRLLADADGIERGYFALVEVAPADGQSWPVEGLGLEVREALLQRLRNDASAVRTELGEGRALVVRPAAIRRFGREKLTEIEDHLVEHTGFGARLDQMPAGPGGRAEQRQAAARLVDVGLLTTVDAAAAGDGTGGAIAGSSATGSDADRTAERPVEPSGAALREDQRGPPGREDAQRKPTVPRDAVGNDADAVDEGAPTDSAGADVSRSSDSEAPSTLSDGDHREE